MRRKDQGPTSTVMAFWLLGTVQCQHAMGHACKHAMDALLGVRAALREWEIHLIAGQH